MLSLSFLIKISLTNKKKNKIVKANIITGNITPAYSALTSALNISEGGEAGIKSKVCEIKFTFINE